MSRVYMNEWVSVSKHLTGTVLSYTGMWNYINVLVRAQFYLHLTIKLYTQWFDLDVVYKVNIEAKAATSVFKKILENQVLLLSCNILLFFLVLKCNVSKYEVTFLLSLSHRSNKRKIEDSEKRENLSFPLWNSGGSSNLIKALCPDPSVCTHTYIHTHLQKALHWGF